MLEKAGANRLTFIFHNAEQDVALAISPLFRVAEEEDLTAVISVGRPAAVDS